ncbi:MAG: hypothetical protein ACP5QO_11395 [Clostridia bacterium]
MGVAMARVAITGHRPLLFHHLDPVFFDGPSKPGKAPGNNPDEWKRTALWTADRQCYLLPDHVFATARDGGSKIRRGRGSLMGEIVSTLEVREDRILLDRWVPLDHEITRDPNQPVYVDVRMVKNPATRLRNMRYRLACSPGWHAAFTLLWEDTVVHPSQLEAALVEAGLRIGIGDGRGVGFGRFTVDAFTLEDPGA